MTKAKTITQTPTDKVALITGAAKRVGAAVALDLARQGMDIAITFNHSETEARQLVQQIERLGRRAHAIRIDLALPDAAGQVHRAFVHYFDRLDALINNAGFFEPSPVGSITTEQFDRNMAVNARAPMMLIQQFAPMLKAHYQKDDPVTVGRVVNFIDIHVMGQPLQGYLAYNASKAALKEVTMTMAMELAPQVTVNAIAPGVIAWADSYTDQMKEDYLHRVPLAVPGTPQDAAAAVRYLVCQAHYCTGQIIKLDGGRLLT